MNTAARHRSPLAELLHLALPMMVSQGAFAVMVFVDRLFLSRIDAAHIAGAMGGGVMFFVTLSLFTGVLSYANALVAQYYGAGALQKCPRVVTQGMLMLLLAQPVLAVLVYLLLDVFVWMGHDPALVVLERRYYLTLAVGAPLIMTKTLIACYFAGISRTRVVMISDVAGVILNIPLSYALIFGRAGLPELGIVGAGLGTLIASVVSIGIYALFYFSKLHRQRFAVMESFQLDRGILRRYLRLGAPAGFEEFIGAWTFNIFLLMFQAYGVVQGAAMAIVFNWDMLSFVPMVGISIALMSLTGQAVGARDMSRADATVRAGFGVSLTYSGTLAVVFVVFRLQLLLLFSTPGQDFSEILAIGSPMMVAMATYVMADAVILVCTGVLRGAGDTRWLMVTSTILHLLLFASQYLMIMVWEVDPLVSWWGLVIMILALAAMVLWRLRSGVWRQAERLDRVMVEA